MADAPANPTGVVEWIAMDEPDITEERVQELAAEVRQAVDAATTFAREYVRKIVANCDAGR
jgi:hypothetical protein